MGADSISRRQQNLLTPASEFLVKIMNYLGVKRLWSFPHSSGSHSSQAGSRVVLAWRSWEAILWSCDWVWDLTQAVKVPGPRNVCQGELHIGSGKSPKLKSLLHLLKLEGWSHLIPLKIRQLQNLECSLLGFSLALVHYFLTMFSSLSVEL